MINYSHRRIQLQGDETSTDLGSCRLVNDLLKTKDTKLYKHALANSLDGQCCYQLHNSVSNVSI